MGGGLQLVCSEPNTDATIGGDVNGHFAFDAQKNSQSSLSVG